MVIENYLSFIARIALNGWHVDRLQWISYEHTRTPTNNSRNC